MVQHPEVLWAQRSSETDEEKNVLYITINLPDIKPGTLEYNLTPTSISFKAKSGPQEKEYAFDLELFKEVVPEKSKSSLTSRSLSLVLLKKDKQSEYWPRLTKEKVKNAFIKTDFSKWVDEDEQSEALDETPDMDIGGAGGMGGMPGGMGGIPGMGGMGGGMDFEKMMAQMGGMGGMGDMDLGGAGPSGADENEDDSDDDGPPPLEDAEPAK
ncbi:HSP20-like chaperone [Pholiota molesta]|nr:HSP20-like chaperone [Pholiota molesta]